MLLNVLGRLGLSLVPGTWMNQPYFIIIPEDAILFYTKDFVVAVLLWEPGVLLGNGIQPSKFCTIGLFDSVLIISDWANILDSFQLLVCLRV